MSNGGRGRLGTRQCGVQRWWRWGRKHAIGDTWEARTCGTATLHHKELRNCETQFLTAVPMLLRLGDEQEQSEPSGAIGSDDLKISESKLLGLKIADP